MVRVSGRPKGERKRSPWTTLLPVLAIVVVLLVVPFWVLRPREQIYTVRTYQTAAVIAGSLVEYARALGTVVPRLEQAVLAPSQGVVDAWHVSEGDEVAVGSALGMLRSNGVESSVVSRREDLAQAERALQQVDLDEALAQRQDTQLLEQRQADLEVAQRHAENQRRLFEIGAIPRVDRDAAEDQLARAERAVTSARQDSQTNAARRALQREDAVAAVNRAQEALVSAQMLVEALALEAPITGRIIELHTTVGQSVAEGTALLTIASSTDLRVRAEFTETAARRVAIGQPANLRVGGTDHRGAVAQVAQQAHATAEGPMVFVTLVFDTSPSDLRLGASVTVEVEVGRIDDALLLPRGPYLATGGETMAYVLNGDNSEATRTTVNFGLVDGNNVQVRNGLSAGQRILTSSYEAFREHAIVRLAPQGEIR